MRKKKSDINTPPKPTTDPGSGMKWVLNDSKTGWTAVSLDTETYEVEKDASIDLTNEQEEALIKTLDQEASKDEMGEDNLDILKACNLVNEVPLVRSKRNKIDKALDAPKQIYYRANLSATRYLIEKYENK